MKLAYFLAMCVVLPFSAAAQVTVFNDTFSGGSTLNTANTTPSGNTTGYQIASTKNATGSSLGAGTLQLTFPSTSSGIAELQAIFTTSPVTLSTIGDSITLNITFTDTSGLLLGTSSFLSGGLYNSGGIAPVASGGLANAGLASTSFTTGNAQNWVGYVGRINGNGGTSIIGTRAAQISATNAAAQDLIGTGFSATGGYHNPPVTQLHTQASTVTMTTGDVFVYTLTYSLSAADTLTISDSLTDSTSSTLLFSDSATASGANFLTNSFDALAFGDRTATTGVANTMDISQILITSNLSPVPEPATVALVALAGIGFVCLRRFRR